MNVIDDVLSKKDLDNITNLFYSTDFPWYYNNFKNDENDLLKDDYLYDCQFTHNFYKNFNVTSPHIGVIEPILQILNPCAIYRIKANITTCTKKIIEFPFHEDEKGLVGKTAIFYVNDNNGYTEFLNNIKVDSVSNRLCIFDSTTLHRGTTSTNTKTRCVINFNYFEWG